MIHFILRDYFPLIRLLKTNHQCKIKREQDIQKWKVCFTYVSDSEASALPGVYGFHFLPVFYWNAPLSGLKLKIKSCFFNQLEETVKERSGREVSFYEKFLRSTKHRGKKSPGSQIWDFNLKKKKKKNVPSISMSLKYHPPWGNFLFQNLAA